MSKTSCWCFGCFMHDWLKWLYVYQIDKSISPSLCWMISLLLKQQKWKILSVSPWHTHTHTRLLAALCITNDVRNSAWHLSVRRRVFTAAAVSGRCAWTHSGCSVAHNSPVCVTDWVCVCLNSIFVRFHVSFTNPSMSWQSVCVHSARIPGCETVAKAPEAPLPIQTPQCPLSP